MPMQRKRPREASQRFHYRFLERHDMFQMCQLFLVSACWFMHLGMNDNRGLSEEDMLIAGMLVTLSTVLSQEAHKKPRNCRTPPGPKSLCIADFGANNEDYFYK